MIILYKYKVIEEMYLRGNSRGRLSPILMWALDMLWYIKNYYTIFLSSYLEVVTW